MKSFRQLFVRFLMMGLLTAPMMSTVLAGIPVIDAGSIAQSLISAEQNVLQTAKQIKEYKLQLKEYDNMIQNTLAPSAYLWGQVESTINNLMSAVNTLNYYKNYIGSINAYLDKYKNVGYYRNSPCFTTGNCTDAQWKLLKEGEEIGEAAQERANDALIRGIDQQQDKIVADSLHLKQLQSATQGSRGHMDALQYANQLAALQTQQLLQMRTMLTAQQTALTTRAQTLADRDARWKAAHEAATLRLSPKVLPGGRDRSISEAF